MAQAAFGRQQQRQALAGFGVADLRDLARGLRRELSPLGVADPGRAAGVGRGRFARGHLHDPAILARPGLDPHGPCDAETEQPGIARGGGRQRLQPGGDVRAGQGPPARHLRVGTREHRPELAGTLEHRRRHRGPPAKAQLEGVGAAGGRDGDLPGRLEGSFCRGLPAIVHCSRRRRRFGQRRRSVQGRPGARHRHGPGGPGRRRHHGCAIGGCEREGWGCGDSRRCGRLAELDHGQPGMRLGQVRVGAGAQLQ